MELEIFAGRMAGIDFAPHTKKQRYFKIVVLF